MDKARKALALDLLEAKSRGGGATYAQIASRTGYSERQLMRLAHELADGGRQAALAHGNTGRKAVNAAGGGEVRYLEQMKERYPHITIAQFRDIYFEDVLQNPKKAGDVEEYGLVPRSESWFGALFRREGWSSPAQRPRRAEGSRVTHPIREPLDRFGEMLQIDATPYDWLGDGRAWALHLTVDDATTTVTSGWFMPRECMRGYARAMAVVLVRYGAPLSLYSDKHSVFVSKKGGATQFGRMMEGLGIRMIQAGTPQAKGRVERYNRTAQLRLENDIIRFGIKDYDELNSWFNGFYAGYLNSRFAFRPRDPRSAFASLPAGFDLSAALRTSDTRVADGGRVSIGNALYYMVDKETGEFFDPGQGAVVEIHADALTDEMYAERDGKRYLLLTAGERRRDAVLEAEGQRELARLLEEIRQVG